MKMLSTLTKLDLKVKDPADKQTGTLFILSGCHTIYIMVPGVEGISGNNTRIFVPR